MTRTLKQDDERIARVEFATGFGEDAHRPWMQECYSQWQRWNIEFFEGVLKAPHIDFGRTAHRSLGHCSPTTGYGAPLQILLNEGLVFGTNPEWVVRPWGEGHRRFVVDLLLRLVVQQYVLEHHGNNEPGYRGNGPLFTEHANRIGLRLRLPPVIVRRRGTGDAGEPVAAGWPFCVRPQDYYEDDVTEGLIELASGSSSHRATRMAASPMLGAWELVLFLLAVGRTDDLRRMAAAQVDQLHALRRRRNPVLARFERGLEDEDGTPITALPGFYLSWLEWNGGTVRSLAQGAYEFRDFSYLPILADALEEAGCYDALILRHLRSRTKGHDSRCWVLRGASRRCRNPLIVTFS